MKKAFRTILNLGLCIVFSSAGIASAYTLQAKSPADSGGAYDCTNVALDEIDPNLLTKEERIALLDGSLRESIDSYSTCVNQVASSMSGNGSGTYEGGEVGEAGGIANGGSGTQPEQPQVSEVSPEDLPPIKTPSSANREVIAPKDNDKIICKLLFKEIKSTQDADILKGLKEQYTNYKCGS